MKSRKQNKLCLVLSGGGARGAYEAGIIHYIRTMLPPKIRSRNFDILCGNSVGAISTAFLAAHANDPDYQGRKICEVWEELREENIYRKDISALINFLYRVSYGLSKKLLGMNKVNSSFFRSFLDTSPLLKTLNKHIPFKRISKNIQTRALDAVSIVATNVVTGNVELFIEKHKKVAYTGDYRAHFGPLQSQHIAASAAIPIIFPTITVNGTPYTDGGIRLNTPLSPGIQLGADKIIVISLHHSSNLHHLIDSNNQPVREATLSEVLGRVMDSWFSDRVQSDIEQLERINNLIDFGESISRGNFIEKFNEEILRRKKSQGLTGRGFKRLKVLRIHPSENIGKIFTHCYENRKDMYFSAINKALVKLLDIDPASGNEFLSYISFIPPYLKTLLYLGFEDANNYRENLIEFLEE